MQNFHGLGANSLNALRYWLNNRLSFPRKRESIGRIRVQRSLRLPIWISYCPGNRRGQMDPRLRGDEGLAPGHTLGLSCVS